MRKVLIFLCFFVFCSILWSQNKTISVYYFHRPPLYTLDNSDKPEGFISKIVDMILHEANIKHSFISMPSKRVELSLQNQDYACGIGWFKKPEREDFAIFSEPIYKDQKLSVIYSTRVKSKIPADVSIEQLFNSNLLLGVIDGFSYGAWADDKISILKPGNEKFVTEQDNLLNLLIAGRADYTLIGFEEGRWLLDKNPEFKKSLRLITISNAPEGNLRYIMFSKSIDKSTVSHINKAILKVKKSPEYKKIISQYN